MNYQRDAMSGKKIDSNEKIQKIFSFLQDLEEDNLTIIFYRSNMDIFESYCVLFEFMLILESTSSTTYNIPLGMFLDMFDDKNYLELLYSVKYLSSSELSGSLLTEEYLNLTEYLIPEFEKRLLPKVHEVLANFAIFSQRSLSLFLQSQMRVFFRKIKENAKYFKEALEHLDITYLRIIRVLIRCNNLKETIQNIKNEAKPANLTKLMNNATKVDDCKITSDFDENDSSAMRDSSDKLPQHLDEIENHIQNMMDLESVEHDTEDSETTTYYRPITVGQIRQSRCFNMNSLPFHHKRNLQKLTVFTNSLADLVTRLD